jgi:ribosomal protein S12
VRTRDELRRLDLLLAASHRAEPRLEAAPQHRDVLVAEVAQEPPQPGGAAGGAVVVRDDEDALADPRARRRLGKGIRAR